MPPNPLTTLQAIRHAEGHGETPAEKAVNLELQLPEIGAEKPSRGSADDGGARTLTSAKASQHEAESPVSQSYGLASEDRSELVAELDKSGGALCRHCVTDARSLAELTALLLRCPSRPVAPPRP